MAAVNCLILHAGDTDAFTGLPTSITLQPNETSATVNITVIDDQLPEDTVEIIISADVDMNGHYQSSVLRFAIQDNDCESTDLKQNL